ncbi:type II secretion system F family protein [Mannheimia massilioguelmaensis]|uniref:type II secretion system F family protein n=1 Tax=Mannheimia massilioguelmaensis TaxID=1604354 RepID=UPI0005C8CAE9|nr:type II secretion system F family protein [Mannheimia massilioguelmaensis]
MKLKRYHWKAINRFKQMQKGVLISESERHARQLLLAQGLQQIKLQQDWQFRTTPKNTEICDLLMQLAMLLDSQITLKESLFILIQNSSSIALNHWLRKLLANLESGLSFSQALEQQGLYISQQEQQLVKVGEMTGKLALVCQQIALHRQQQIDLKRKLQKILIYPLAVLCISISLTVGLLIFIVPQFAEMYSDRQQLPVITELLLSLSSITTQYFWHMLLLCLLLIILVRKKLQYSRKLNYYKQQLLNFIPIFNEINQQARLINFCQGLQLMLSAGIPLQQSLQSFLPKIKTWQTTQKLQGDIVLTEEVQLILEAIHQGYKFSESVGSRLFPQQARQILQVGERSGQLANILGKLAENYHQQLSHKIDLLSQLLEPILMLIIGAIIGFIMLGMYLPIFTMGNLI